MNTFECDFYIFFFILFAHRNHEFVFFRLVSDTRFVDHVTRVERYFQLVNLRRHGHSIRHIADETVVIGIRFEFQNEFVRNQFGAPYDFLDFELGAEIPVICRQTEKNSRQIN